MAALTLDLQESAAGSLRAQGPGPGMGSQLRGEAALPTLEPAASGGLLFPSQLPLHRLLGCLKPHGLLISQLYLTVSRQGTCRWTKLGKGPSLCVPPSPTGEGPSLWDGPASRQRLPQGAFPVSHQWWHPCRGPWLL